MAKIIPIGTRLNFNSSKEAYQFYADNKNHVADDAIMAIPQNDTRAVLVRPLGEPDMHKRDRSGEVTGRSTHGDDLGEGVKGVVNHADGKRYDSKSEFRKATRRAGCYEVGNDIKSRDVNWKPPIERGMRGDFNVAPALKEALQRVRGS